MKTRNVRHRQWERHVARQRRHGYAMTPGVGKEARAWMKRGDWKDRVRDYYNRRGAEIEADYPTLGPMYYDRQGRPIGLGDQMILRDSEGGNYHRVAEDRIKGVRISTVWLGHDQSSLIGGRPLIFETMVFGGPLDMEQWRYATEDEARAGHAAVVTLVQRELLG